MKVPRVCSFIVRRCPIYGQTQNFILENALDCDNQVIRILAYMKYEFDFV